MEYQNRVTMAISDWTNYIDDNDIEFAFGKVDFLSNKPNSHKHMYTEDVIKKYAPTVLGKWVIADYNKYTNDATTHTSDEVIVGYVPLSQEVTYRYDESGYLIASVDVIISKLYATNVYEMFKEKNYKSVSIEELVNFTEETKDLTDGVNEKVIESFNVCGITILGDKYNPSVPNANIQLTKMSDEESNKQLIEDAYITYSEKHNKDNSIDKIDIVLSKLESIERIINKEELMENSEMKELQNSTEQVEEVVNAEEEQKVENSEEQAVENADCGDGAEAEENAEATENACGDEATTENACGENEEVENAEDGEDEDEDKEDGAKEEEVDNSAIEMSELQTKLSEAEAKIASYEAELAELRTFKESVQNSEKVSIANQTLEKIKSFITDEDYEEYKKEFNECSYEEVGALKNSILAKYVDEIIEKSQGTKEETEIVDYGIPVANAKVESIYD